MITCLRRRLGLHHQLLGVAAEVGALLALVPLHAAVQQPRHHQDGRGQGDPGLVSIFSKYFPFIFFYDFLGAGRRPRRCLLGNTKGEKEEERV